MPKDAFRAWRSNRHRALRARRERERQARPPGSRYDDRVATPDALKELRDRLLRLHRTLLDAERAAYERAYGPVRSNNEWLQLVLRHEHFDWLRTFSGLIVRIDTWIATSDAPASEGDALWSEVDRITAIDASSTDETRMRYREALDRSAEAAVAHAQIRRMLDRA